MKCVIKVNELYVKDFQVNIVADANIINEIELDKEKSYIFDSGQEAEFFKHLMNKELDIPKEKIKIFGIE